MNRVRLTAAVVIGVLPVLVAFISESRLTDREGYMPDLLPHPHFTKTLNCKLSKGLEVTVSHLTVTFDKEGAEKMPVGGMWHLGGATFESTGDLVIGGQEVKAGKYALSARKDRKAWELTLHAGAGFSRPRKDAPAIVLRSETAVPMGKLRSEHLHCDIQPSGDKKDTKLFLEVRFDTLLARVLIEIPKQ